MRRLLLLALLPLAGCAGNLKLLEDGKVHEGSWNGATRQIEATIDGKKYSGSFTRQVSTGFGQSFGSGSVYGRRPVYFNQTTTSTAFASDGSGQAVLTSEDGKVIQCVFQAAMGRGQGQCEGMDGRRFVLVIGG